MKNILSFFHHNKDIIPPATKLLISDDLILLESSIFPTWLQGKAFETSATMIAFITQGEIHGLINRTRIEIKEPSTIVFLQKQRLTLKYISPDIKYLLVIMSNRFISELNMDKSFYLAVYHCPICQMTSSDLQEAQTFFRLLHKAMSIHENPYKMHIVQGLTHAYFYGKGYQAYFKSREGNNSCNNIDKSRITVKQFFKLIHIYGKQHHSVNFYAQQLRLSPKYLSETIKQTSGHTAKEWINKQLITEAKELLKDHRLNIQEIGFELNFPSPVAFGNFFKRLTNFSPKTYRETFYATYK